MAAEPVIRVRKTADDKVQGMRLSELADFMKLAEAASPDTMTWPPPDASLKVTTGVRGQIKAIEAVIRLDGGHAR